MFSVICFSTVAQQNPEVLSLCVDPDWMPYEAVINGKHTGIASDYLHIFEQLTSYKFNINKTSWKGSTENLKSGKCDLTLMLNRTAERERYLNFTIPYFLARMC